MWSLGVVTYQLLEAMAQLGENRAAQSAVPRSTAPLAALAAVQNELTAAAAEEICLWGGAFAHVAVVPCPPALGWARASASA